MRCVSLLLLALLVGAAPALAQESPAAMPVLAPTEAQPVKKHVRHRAAARKPAAPKPAAPKAAESDKPAAATKTQSKPNVAKKVEPAPAGKQSAPLPRPKPAVATAAPAAAPKPVAKAEVAKAAPTPESFAGIPANERLKIQAALLWSGDYPAEANGDDPLTTAIRNFRKRHKSKVAGPLTPPERADLLAAAKTHEDEFGWDVVVDPATGIRIGLPTKLVPKARDAARGTQWTSAHGEVQVETFRIKESESKLAALFEQQKKEPATRKVESSVLHDDNFFISGQQGLKRFSVRAKARDGEVRGFTILYDQMMETIVAPVMVAMASAFSPFPEQRSAPYAVLAKSVEYGSGLVVSAQGHIVTDRKITEGCQVLVASGLGDADRVAVDNDSGLALLRVYGPRRTLAPLPLTYAAPKSAELTLFGIPDPREQNGARKLTEVKAKLADGRAIELRQPVPMAGLSGAAALDAQGRFLGMTQMGNAVLASIEASTPPVRLVSAETIRNFLAAQHVDPAPTPGTDARASVVRIICVRK